MREALGVEVLARGRDAYKWADARVEDKFLSGLRDPRVKRLVVDGTGTNEERQIRRMTQARAAGFYVKAMYVRVPVRTAIARAAMRKTGVTPQRIQLYQSKMAHAMDVAGRHADEVRLLRSTGTGSDPVNPCPSDGALAEPWPRGP